jgi:hypothetical protein
MKIYVLNVESVLCIVQCVLSKTGSRFLNKILFINITKNKKMKKNMGSIDKIIRILVAVVVVILYFANIISGTAGIILLVVSAVFVVTAVLGICPLYSVLRLRTIKKD